jgi:threonine/homoserine/homoserine lactone efflux protein
MKAAVQILAMLAAQAAIAFPIVFAVGWVIPGVRRLLAEDARTALITALSGVLVALIGAWGESASASLRERMAKIEGRVDALEKAK